MASPKNLDTKEQKQQKPNAFLEFVKSLFSSDELAVTAQRVAFSYKDQAVLKDFSVEIAEGDLIAIIGKSGSGKSTFLKLITGVISQRYTGSIRIYGKDRRIKKREIGYVPQEQSFIPTLTLEDNITLFGKLHGLTKEVAQSSATKLLKLMHLEEFRDAKPNTLSGGQRVRFNIILSLLHDPKIIILDEPFVGLDYYNRKLLWLFFQSQQKKKKTLILTTHLLTEVEQYASRIYLLKKGKVWAKGTAEHIKKHLKSKMIVEIQTKKNISHDQVLDIKEYCRKKPITLIDIYEQTLLFSIENTQQRTKLTNFLNRIKLPHTVKSAKTATMDEAVMGME